MAAKILHVLSQRPSRTGSGITLSSVIRLARLAGWDQAAVVGVPAGDQPPAVGGLGRQSIHPVSFQGEDQASGRSDLDFPVPGMSDVMPYPSSVWSTLSANQLDRYRQVWKRRLKEVLENYQPDLIHTNHLWLVSSLIKDIAPSLPVVVTCHATGLRQLDLCPHLAPEVIQGCARNDRFLVLRKDHARQLKSLLSLAAEKIRWVGVGFREDIFRFSPHCPGQRDQNLLFVGKYSHSKGLPCLLDAVAALREQHPQLRLQVAGSGSGPEADQLRSRMRSMAPQVVMRGQLGQEDLADLMHQCRVCVLPSFYEGVPLVLAEAAACGCRLVATDLPGITEQIAPVVGSLLETVPRPRMSGIDTPVAEDLPAFNQALAQAINRALQTPPAPPANLESLTWTAVFQRVQSVWKELLQSES